MSIPTQVRDSVERLVERARGEDFRATARLVSLVEDESPLLRDVMRALAPYPMSAHVLGLTGAPGVGKSTTTSMLVAGYRAEGKRVGVLAVDPSSPFSGGALLGDRVRMQDHALDRGVFIRSMATRGHLGGLAWATPQAVRVLDAAGFDVVIVETVGVGQSEVDIAAAADTTIVLLAPGMGDAIQASKAGILEIGDVYVVNKSDREGAHQVVKELRNSLALVSYEPGSWKPPIVSTVAWKNEGGDDVLAAVAKHRAWSEETGSLTSARRRRVETEITEIALTTLRRRFDHLPGDVRLSGLVDDVLAGSLDPYAAADELVAGATDVD